MPTASRIALIGQGLNPDTLVGLCVDRSLDMLVGVLGILKAGGAYLPMDPGYPEDRLVEMLDDAGVELVVVQTSAAGSLACTGSNARCCRSMGRWARMLLQGCADSRIPVSRLGLSPANLAYAIYTSGSTGKPKGVLLEHRGMVNLALSQSQEYAVGPDSRVLAFASMSFDAAASEWLMALVTGASLYICDETTRHSGEHLSQFLLDHRITHATIPPAMLAHVERDRDYALETVIVAGEACDESLAWRWAERWRICNAYGPSEGTVAASSADIRPGQRITLGRALANVSLQVLDAALQPQPIGVTGELYLGGMGLARGYLNRPELTAERFVTVAGERMYRTGDLARWLPNGELQFIGRADEQIKIRGFRIEPGEVENALRSDPMVREAVVIARRDEGQPRLVAYVVCHETDGERNEALLSKQWRARLKQTLPDYMLPAAFVVLEALPVTRNGKVDKRRLPKPEYQIQHDHVAPEGEIETTLAEIWQELLGIARVGRHDNFFELGGHSLMAVSLIERMRREGLHADVRDLFLQPTLAQLAQAVGSDSHDVIVPPNLIPADATAITPQMLTLVQLDQDAIDRIVSTVEGGAANVQDIYPLAPLQEGILFHHLMEQQGDPYLLPSMLGFASRERLDRFVAALQQVIDRHDILRTGIAWQGLEQPVQLVYREASLPIRDLGLRGDLLPQLLEITDPRHLRLDLQQAPLLAAYVAADPDQQTCYVALFSHHLICDHVTQELLIAEVKAILEDRAHELPPTLPYRNFIAQSHAVSDEQHETWFREQLADVDEPTLPFGVIDARNSGAEIKETMVSFDARLALRIREAARAQGVTAAVLFHLGWAHVLGRCSNRDDVVFGTVLSGRQQGVEGADRALGMFINTLPLRVPMAGLSVREAVQDTRSRMTELLVHEQASLSLAQRCSGVAPPMPLFTALMNYRHNHENGQAKQANAGLQGIRLLDEDARNNYPITMSVEDLGQGFALTALSCPGIDGLQLCRQLATVMSGLVDALELDPQRAMADLPLLTDQDHQQLLRDSRGPHSTQHRDAMLPAQFAQQAARTPDAIALRQGGITLRYAELNERSNRLAHALIELGLGHGSRVGVHLPRSPELLIALLAVMKTGAAYVMLDLRQAPERLQAMVLDAGIEVALVDSRHSVLPVGGLDTVYLDGAASDADWLGEYPSSDPDIAIDGEDSVYVLYTSGSTGTPKGVEIRHSGLIDYCGFAREGYWSDALAGSLVVTSAAFDLTVPSLYVPLLVGACVELLPEADELAALAARMEDATTPAQLLRMTPSHVQALLSLADGSPREAAHVFVIGGESFSVALARQLQDKYPRSRILNHYGPTETVVGCACFDVTANLSRLDRTIPIGRPMSNTVLYVLGASGELQPIGVAGELYIGGAGVAKGYLNQPELTAAKFVADPFTAGERLYRSGDRVRWNAEGNLEFLGRFDDQVKLRGFRIELGDIEACLQRAAEVREARVLVQGEGDAARLVAYVVSTADEGLVERLKAQLASQLPVYMQPTAWVRLDSLPLTVNGKLDRNRLPVPELQLAQYQAPETPTEILLAGIWSRLLKHEDISRDADFFELGGHSLLATRVISEIARSLGKPVALRALFEHSTLAALAAHLDAQENQVYLGIPRTDRNHPLPLSFAQQRLWFIDQLDGHSSQYNMPAALRIRGRIDLAALQAALDALVERHEVLRTRFVEIDGTVQQRIDPAQPLMIQRDDLRSLEPPEREQQLRVIALSEAGRAFDLGADPMLRARLVALDEDTHALLFTMHHIASDGWSLGVLVREFAALYEAHVQGQPAGLAPLPVQYADYAVWQRTRLQGENLRRELEHWHQHLDGLPVVHNLPLDKPRPAVQRFEGGTVEHVLSDSVLRRLNAIARAHDASLFMVLQAAFAALLSRWSGDTDIVMGTPIAGRLHKDVEPLIGFFVNTLVLRTDLSANPDFGSLIRQSRERALAAYSHQEIPFEMLAEELKPARSLGHTPLFQVLFSMRNNEQAALALPGLELSTLGTEVEPAKFDLQLTVTESTSGLELAWTYASSLFEHASIVRMAAGFEQLVMGALDAPERPLSDLPLITDRDRALIAGWNSTAREYRRDACIHTLFQDTVAKAAQRPALVMGDASLSYLELDQRSNQLASRLVMLGVRPGDCVGLCLDRGFDQIIGLLAILKAGAAYVPLDPAYPPARLGWMLEDSGLSLVLTHSVLAGKIDFGALQTLELDRDTVWMDCPDGAPCNVVVDGDALAFLMYTSGSTGRPKGVELTHRTIVNLMDSLIARHALMAAELPTLQFATINFDMSLYEIASALFTSSPLILLNEDDRLDMDRLIAILQQHSVGRVYLPTAVLAPFAQAVIAQAAQLPALKILQVAGEALAITPTIREWARLSGCSLLNLYGPTESHVVSEQLLIGDPDAWPTLPPIGRPIDNVRLHVLDAAHQPVPVGVVGELWIAGDNLARGYRNRPELTCERFRELCIEGVAERVYRSGDLVRWLPDGTIEYVGRADTQVKLRGFRIELGEIESLLGAHDAVTESVVIAVGEGSDKRLVAYVGSALAGQDDAALVSSLRASLETELPPYMLPSAIVVLSQLPLTANGKVDRRALPDPDLRPAEHVPPETPTEIRLAEIWARILKLDVVGRDANFFELGGHSLLATRVVSEVSRSFGKPLPVRAVFEYASLSRLATHIDAQAQQDHRPIPRAGRDHALPLSFSQQRLWFIDRLEGGSTQYNLPAALRLDGALDAAALQQALDALVERHEVLRTTFAEVDGQALQWIQAASPVPIAHEDLSGLPTERQQERLRELARDEATRPFDLAVDCMLRARLVRLANDAHALLVTLHHIASDGWSMAVLIREFGELYSAIVQSRDPVLEPLPVQYADYAVWQRERLSGESLQTQLGWWRTQLSGLPVVHNLPLDKPRPTQQRFAGATVERVLAASTLGELKRIALRHEASLFMVLEAAFAALLWRWSGETDIVIGTPIAGRLHKDVEPLIGFFVNTLVLRNDLSGAPDFETLLGRTRSMALGAYAHQEIPFETLAEEIRPVRSLSHTPLFQVLFSMRNNEQAALELPGLSLTTLTERSDLAKFDLQLAATESDQGLELSWTYATTLFAADSVQRMAEAFERLLAGIVASTRVPLDRLDLVGTEARDAILALGQGERSECYRAHALPQQIAAQAASTPNAIAVRQGKAVLDYAALDGKANRLARALLGRGLGHGSRVGVHLQRSPELLIALLAVMKTGAAYVMLDLRQAPERLQAMVLDAGIEVALVDSRHSVLPVGGLDTVYLDGAASDADWLGEYPSSDPDIAIDGEDSVYVLYTSGSTGTPKGVEIRHSGLIDYCGFAREGYWSDALAGSLVVTSAAFDLTVPSLYVPLLVGACVELLPEADELAALAARMEDATTPAQLLRMTPSHVQALLSLADGSPREAAHVFVIGGESFSVALARQLQDKYPRSRILNHYGPTETVVGCACFDVTANLSRLDRTIPIGRPMSNTVLYVLGASGELQPIGVAGELYIGGAGVAKGYLNQPELTAAKFVADPFTAGERLYRSGDRVRWNAEGNLEFLGRFDDQVKLRGFRIELGDIEACLQRAAEVREARVLVQGEGDAARLVAYVVSTADEGLVERLKAQLASQLPVYMQPTAWVRLDSLPLTVNGKLDRNRLPVPELQLAQYQAPETPTEILLAGIWQDVLGLPQVSVTADFFELGGHSLLATRLINAVQRELKVEIPIRLLFERSDIRSISALIDAQEIRRKNLANALRTHEQVEMEW
jgi:amino acid adenylation domain-containing protein